MFNFLKQFRIRKHNNDYSQRSSKQNSDLFIHYAIKFLQNAIEYKMDMDLLKTKYIALSEYYKVPISGSCAGLNDDFKRFLDLYESNTHDFIDLNPDLNLTEKLELLVAKSKMILNEKHHSELPKLYKTYRRWLNIENKKIEVELILDYGWDGKIFKSKIDGNLFLMDLEWRNGGYITKIKNISIEDFESIKTKHNKTS